MSPYEEQDRPGPQPVPAVLPRSYDSLSQQEVDSDQHRPSASSTPRINTVSYRNATIKAQIDTTMVVADVIRQLCANAHLGVQEPPALFALRDDENDELIDDGNLARKIEAGRNFKLTASPLIEAAEMVDKLCSREDRALKMATYTLQKLIREPVFTAEFLKRGGLNELLLIVHTFGGGNTLAYALTSCQNLLEGSNEGMEGLDGAFIARVVQILVTQERINVCRPATAILKRLVVSEAAPTRDTAAKTSAPSSKFGFEAVYEQICREPSFLPTLVQRLSSADATLCVNSLSLLNSLVEHATERLLDSLATELERLKTSSAVARLMDTNCRAELAASILEYQTNVVRIYKHRLLTSVSLSDKRHTAALTYIWKAACINEESVVRPQISQDPRSSAVLASGKHKWRRIGFTNENVAKDFARSGWLGVECCEAYVRRDPEGFATLLLEQINRSESKRCPWGRAAIEVVQILVEHWGIQSKSSARSDFTPFLLSFTRVHQLVLRFFFRIWAESGAATVDFERVSALVQSQVKVTLVDEATKSWLDIEKSFVESEYSAVRDRQMRELELEDDLENNSSVQALKAKLHRENWEFMRQQRVQCLLEGAWFRVAGNTRFGSGAAGANATIPGQATPNRKTGATNGTRAYPKPWRFYRLSPNKRLLHFCEADEPHAVRHGLDDLPRRIDLAQVNDLALQSCITVLGSMGEELPVSSAASTTNGSTNYQHRATTTISASSSSAGNYSFSLLRAPGDSIADLVATSASQYSEWVDGLSMLRGEGSAVNTQETAEYIQALTDIAVKIKLLDLTGEKVEIPAAIPQPGLPMSLDFFFAEL
ncbi:hypothetical protein BCV69DRAFT_298172 [Microstroma glucosiphilum]|uniref:ELMO domain-containing protein n=1 Tax=Pseudomicrostroma glucosiphilum TaxID=1684307 RepID=A0A316UFR0_9BASI|nr:hypothetical protein BCV69DRAFT_298172 [Pseudomicrostroma glucosiphilum]PWN21975.1 hypothetical protein BCV69DRAFT_298172 [Pseudomicrostroma glucosiphilum]